MKRVYQRVDVTAEGDGVCVRLNETPAKTPGGAWLRLPTRPLADAIAAEWQAQGQEIVATSMPLTQLANTAIDLVAARLDAIVATVAGYAATDLLCYRADHPPALKTRQNRAWQPLLDWAALRFDAPLRVAEGIVPLEQPRDALRALHAAVAAHPPFPLTALHEITGVSGSLIIGLAVLDGHIDVGTAFDLAQLEETFQIEQWGEDREAARRRAASRADLEAAQRFHALLAPG